MNNHQRRRLKRRMFDGTLELCTLVGLSAVIFVAVLTFVAVTYQTLKFLGIA